MFLTVFPLFMPKSELLLSLFTHLLFCPFLNSNVSDLLTPLLKNSERAKAILSKKQWITISLFCSQKMSD